jgi:hypothetical protein
LNLPPSKWQQVYYAAAFIGWQRISLKVSQFHMKGRASATMPILHRGETRVRMTFYEMDACP